jgi:hypothetical protein
VYLVRKTNLQCVNTGREIPRKVATLHKVNVGADRDERLPESQPLQNEQAPGIVGGGGGREGEGGGGGGRDGGIGGKRGEEVDNVPHQPVPHGFHDSQQHALDLGLLAQLVLL